MEWESFVQGILSEKDALDELRISTEGGGSAAGFPSVIRASVRILDRILNDGGKLNIFVFPEKQQMFFLFMLAKVIHNLTGGKIKHNYDPSQFKIGEKVSLGKAILEYRGTSVSAEGKQLITFKTSDVIITAPIDYLPVLQHIKTHLKLSKHDKYVEEKNKIKDSLKQFGSDSILMSLASHKSHLDKSIAYVSSVSTVMTTLDDCLLDKQKIQDVLLLGRTNYEGTVRNIGPGQLDGNPALVLASDLFCVNAAFEMGHPFQSMIIDISNIHHILSQLDALDEAISMKIPLLCLTDTPSSFDLDEFKKRGFKIWRWDAVSLTDNLMTGDTYLDRRLRNCYKHSIQYCNITDHVLSECMMRLSRQKYNVANQSAEIIKLYDQMMDLTFCALRETMRFGHRMTETAERLCENYEIINPAASPFVPEDMAKDLDYSVSALRKVYGNNSTLPKNQAMREWFFANAYGRKICIIVPENEIRQRVREYWNLVCLSGKLNCEINVYSPSEYCNTRLVRFDTTIITGWMRREIMRKILFSYATQQYVVFLYECERKWKNSEERNWAKAVASSDNKDIIRNNLSGAKSEVSVVRWDSDHRYVSEGEAEDLTELEQTLKENKLRQFLSGSTTDKTEKIRALPVSYIGGYTAFYRLEHKLIQVTGILNKTSDSIKTVTPDELEEGDFVIVREADQDLIRDLADKVLSEEGKTGLRNLSRKWRDALDIELMFSSAKDLYIKMKKAGCKKSWITFTNWLDEDVIAPQDKEDMQIIAKVCDNQTLVELMDKVYEAAKEIRSAHAQAGMRLSKLLTVKIAQVLKEQNVSDVHNIWEPIVLEVEGVGNVKLLKVIDKESEVEIEKTMTNRLLSEF